MIRKAIIENWESHLKTILKFPPGLTVFIGETDRGKSGALRSIIKVLTNKPAGNGMVPLFWDGDPKVSLEFYEGDIVSWFRNKKQNFYQINDQDPINAGTSVPEQVQAITQMDVVNIQEQIDRAFLMFDTPGERGRVINRLAGLDKIDSTISAGKSDIQRIKRRREENLSLLDTKTKQLKAYSQLDSIEDLLDDGDKIEKEIQTGKKTIEELTSLSQTRAIIVRELRPMKVLPGVAATMSIARTLEAEIEQEKSKIKLLSTTRQRWTVTQSSIVTMKTLPRVRHLLKKAQGMQEDVKSDQTFLQEVNRLKTKVHKLQSRLKQIREEKKQVDRERQSRKICSECGQEILNQ